MLWGENFARELLTTLFEAAERESAGVRVRQAALTAKNLGEYRTTRSSSDKEAFEDVMLAASGAQAVLLQWDAGYTPGAIPREGFITRVTAVDLSAFASFLGKTKATDKVSAASAALSPLLDRFPVLNEVLARWARLKTVRGTKPEQVYDWTDAARILDYVQVNRAESAISRPIREASAVLFSRQQANRESCGASRRFALRRSGRTAALGR